MAVPYTFGSATTSIPLSQLDSNFATTITLGNTSIQLGNTVTTLNNMTLGNVTISSGTSNLQTNVANATGVLVVANGGTGLSSIPHTITVLTSGSGTYTTPANCKAIWVRMVAVSYTHSPSPRDATLSRMPSSA